MDTGDTVIAFLSIVTILQMVTIIVIASRLNKLKDQHFLPPELQLQMLDLVRAAYRIMGDLGPRTEIDDCDFLSQYSKDRIKMWMNDYLDLEEKVDDPSLPV